MSQACFKAYAEGGGKPTADPSELVCCHEDTNEQQEQTADQFDGSIVLFDYFKNTYGIIKCDSGQEKWDAKSGRVKDQQEQTIRDGRLICGDEQNGTQDRADAGCPSESKGASNEKGA